MSGSGKASLDWNDYYRLLAELSAQRCHMTAMVSHDHCLKGATPTVNYLDREAGKKFKIAFSTNVAKEKVLKEASEVTNLCSWSQCLLKQLHQGRF